MDLNIPWRNLEDRKKLMPIWITNIVGRKYTIIVNNVGIFGISDDMNI